MGVHNSVSVLLEFDNQEAKVKLLAASLEFLFHHVHTDKFLKNENTKHNFSATHLQSEFVFDVIEGP